MDLNEDPDRFLNFPGPGAHEWWYFDAISEDGRDVLVIVWYAALPFDPDYGVAALRHIRRPDRHPKPVPLDHCAIGLSWYRDGKTLAFALNGYRSADFQHGTDPFTVEVADNRLRRERGCYHLAVDTPSVDGRGRIVADLRFRPATATHPFRRDLGPEGSPHLWILVAADCRVEGEIRHSGRPDARLAFRGRGYHDHNAGFEEMSASMRRWRWSRAHRGPLTEVHYAAETHHGVSNRLTLRCLDGRPVAVDESPSFIESAWTRTAFGIRHPRVIACPDRESWTVETCVDRGPFYLRWLMTSRNAEGEAVPAIGEWLETRNMNRFLFNWMIPYRLKRPRA